MCTKLEIYIFITYDIVLGKETEMNVANISPCE